MTEVERTAFKLVEALAEKCERPDDDDHAWRECRRCLAAYEFERAPKRTRRLMQALLSVRAVWTENCEPFIAWAQSYLDAGRWAGHCVFDAIHTELCERDEQLVEWQTRYRQILEATDKLCHEIRFASNKEELWRIVGCSQEVEDLHTRVIYELDQVCEPSATPPTETT